jgi:hypothetical protein
MLPDDLTDDIELHARRKRAEEERAEEECAEQLLNTVMELSQDEVDTFYREVWPNEDSAQQAFASVQDAVGRWNKEQRRQPLQLRSAFAQLCQRELLPAPKQATPRILLIDWDFPRLLERRRLLMDLNVETTCTTSIAEAEATLDARDFHLVIVDYRPITKEDSRHLLALQEFNLRLPVINVQAWAGLMEGDNRRINRDLLRAAARVLGKRIPRRLPVKRSAGTAGVPTGDQPQLEIG